MTDLQKIPSVDKLLQTEALQDVIGEFGRPLTIDMLRSTLDQIRGAVLEGKPLPSVESIINQTIRKIERRVSPTLRPVINASGVIIHTNLGRAPLSNSAIQAAQDVALGYSNLEYDLEKGKRGSRLTHAEALLTKLTQAEAALVVNNNAAAVLLSLTALARRRRVVIARSQLIEIGGGFRIPDVMAQSGAKLVEIGTTNRVHIEDYQRAIDEQPIKLIFRAHRSNFDIIGFTTEPNLEDISRVAHDAQIPMVDDLGSGSLLDTAAYGLGHETTVQESLAAGADLVCFSGDKLLGGPQAGIIVGKSNLIAKLKSHPLARAIRADKLALAALSATLLHYLKNEATKKIPVWQMIAMPIEEIQNQVTMWSSVLGQGKVILGESTVGGGSLPGKSIATYLLAIDVPKPDRFLARLRACNPPIIARTQDDQVLIDARTVLPEQRNTLLVNLQEIIKGTL
jgi:L-seryl-tRNA(Ser) seleniumtransferase